MNSIDIPSDNHKDETDSNLTEVTGALIEATNALRRLAELAYCNPYGASVLFEFTCDSCRQLGYALHDFPDLKAMFLREHSYYPVIIAENPNGLDSGLRELAIQGEVSQKKTIRTKRGSRKYLINPVPNPDSIFSSLLHRFVDSIICDPRYDSPLIKLTSYRVPEEVKERLLSHEFRYDTGEWSKQFIGLLNPRLLDPCLVNEEDIRLPGPEIVWEEWGERIPDGILLRYATEIMFTTKDGKSGVATYLGERYTDPIKALTARVEERLRALIGEPPTAAKL